MKYFQDLSFVKLRLLTSSLPIHLLPRPVSYFLFLSSRRCVRVGRSDCTDAPPRGIKPLKGAKSSEEDEEAWASRFSFWIKQLRSGHTKTSLQLYSGLPHISLFQCARSLIKRTKRYHISPVVPKLPLSYHGLRTLYTHTWINPHQDSPLPFQVIRFATPLS